MKNKKYLSLVIATAVAGSFAFAAPLFASDDLNIKAGISENMMDSNIVAKVSGISGNTLTVVSQQGSDENANQSPVTYTVNIANARLVRGNTAIAASNIAVGDTVIIQGTVTGTNVVATVVRDGKIGNGNEGDGNNQALLQIKDNGQPIVAGTIRTISGSSITIANSSNVVYTIDAANAKIVQGKNAIPFSGMKIGDSIIAQGSVNGTMVVASTIIDTTAASGTTRHGFFSSIGSFFRRLFGR